MLSSLRGSAVRGSTSISASSKSFLLLPRRLILVRHGESRANVDRSVYSHTPDWKIELTDAGVAQASECGKKIKSIVGEDKLFLYTSPYIRARQTLSKIRDELDPAQVVGEREDERLREQEMGNYQPYELMKATWDERQRSSRFYYRFPHGESGADVCDRVSLFVDSLFRERRELVTSAASSSSEGGEQSFTEQNVIIICHGLFVRLFLGRWYKLPLEVFDVLYNPPNCAVVVLERDDTIGRLVMREECKALFGNDPLVQTVKFDGSDNGLWYESQFKDRKQKSLLEQHGFTTRRGGSAQE